MEQRFSSKVDGWLIVLLISAGVLPVVLILIEGSPAFVPFAAVVVTSLLVAWVFLSTRYDVTADLLRVRSGPFIWRIPLADIRSLRATRNPLSSPALSLDRIEVRHARGWLLISPRDKAGFVDAVLAASPSVAVENLPHTHAAAIESRRPFASSPTSNARRSRAPQMMAVVLATAVLLFMGAIFYFGTRPPAVTLSADVLTIRGGMTSRTMSRSDVISIALADTLPAAHKRTGFNAGRYLRGVFDVDALGRTDLFVIRGAPPYLFIHVAPSPAGSPVVVINFSDAADTEQLYRRIRETWHLP